MKIILDVVAHIGYSMRHTNHGDFDMTNIIQLDNGMFTFSTNIPANVYVEREPTIDDIRSGNYYRNDDGNVVAPSLPEFGSFQEALDTLQS